jgi:hypothetical protein
MHNKRNVVLLWGVGGLIIPMFWVYLSGLTTTSIANFCSYIDYPSLFIKNEDFCTELMTFTWPFWFFTMADRIIYSLASLILNVFLYGFIGYIIYKIKKSRKKIKKR